MSIPNTRAAPPAPAPIPILALVASGGFGASLTGYCMAYTTFTIADVGFEGSDPTKESGIGGGVMAVGIVE